MPLDIGNLRLRSPICRTAKIELDPVDELSRQVVYEFKKQVLKEVKQAIKEIEKR